MKFAMILSVIVGLFVFTAVYAEDKPKHEKPVPQHKVKELPSKEAHRFPKPITQAPNHRPPNRNGGTWHWHVSYGWVWFPIQIAPKQFILPFEYRLPDKIVIAEEVQPFKVKCPVCGSDIWVFPPE